METDLFTQSQSRRAPLAHRVRPLVLEDYYGHEEWLGPRGVLRSWIEKDRVPSLLFWGPPGCGKTTLSRIIAERTSARFESLSAVLSGVKEIREAVERARSYPGRVSILFFDEIHRFNKSQQDALLPHVEEGTVTLIGATTENPSFEMNRALLSRMRVIRLSPLADVAVAEILQRAFSQWKAQESLLLQVETEVWPWMAEQAQGDARRALNHLEALLGVALARLPVEGCLDLESARAWSKDIQQDTQPIAYDRAGEEHYNTVSAFIKSMRDSDPHAALYYLARMIEGGEDPVFIARRMVILASEDVGNADPRGLQLAVAALQAVELVGMPEGRIPLAQAATYLALAPKSNAAYAGIGAALEEVRKSGALPVPGHLRNAVTSLMRTHGYGKGYQYAHNSAGGVVEQTHLPEQLVGTRFYFPKEVGLEIQLKEKLDRIQGGFEGKKKV